MNYHIQTKIDENPTAQKWKKDAESNRQQMRTPEFGRPPMRPMMKSTRVKKKQKGGENKEVDYNAALSALGLIPAVGAAGKALSKAAKIAKAAKKAAPKKKGKKVRKPLNYKKQTGGSFNTGQGSFIEPGTEQI